MALLRLAAAVGGDGLLGGVLPGTLETYWMLGGWQKPANTTSQCRCPSVLITFWPGIALALLSFLHRLDFSRIHDVGMLELRERHVI